jgi:hypothetical protein
VELTILPIATFEPTPRVDECNGLLTTAWAFHLANSRCFTVIKLKIYAVNPLSFPGFVGYDDIASRLNRLVIHVVDDSVRLQ